MVELYNYQEDLLYQVETTLHTDPKARVMMQLPTGGGKTEIAGQLLKGRLTDGCKAVWVTHRRELTEQTCDRLIRADVPARVEKSWMSNDPDAPAMPGGVAILMAQTLGRRTAKGNVWGKYGPDDLMVVDEAHHAPAAGWERSMRQWPGQVVGMTATPWRMEKKEGFVHLFDTLICGPQVADLQFQGYLCNAKVIAPPHEQRILGGNPDRYGEYTPDGIELANSDRPDVMTARALEFWQEHAGDRKKTIVYAVSVNHARNLKALFDEEGIPAGIVLGSTDQKQEERNRAIEEFRDGNLQVLINVAVVTEGFDVPEASCIVITRPTLSLALYMQMVGRGLRAKDGGGDCLILDLADNTSRHKFPNTHREWKLEVRGSESPGEAPVLWCPNCFSESPAASHKCEHCGHPLGQVCGRCKWRPWMRWHREKMCGDAHELVCDLCHADAHVRARLPVSEHLIVPIKDLEPEEKPPKRLNKDGRYWHLLSSETVSNGFKPSMLRTPDGTEIRVWGTAGNAWATVRPRDPERSYIDEGTGKLMSNERSPEFTSPWKHILFKVAEWLARKERLPMEHIPIRLGEKRYVVHTSPEHSDGKPFENRRKLMNGLYLEIDFSRKDICKAVEWLNRMSPPHEQFYVQYRSHYYYDESLRKDVLCEYSRSELCDHPGY